MEARKRVLEIGANIKPKAKILFDGESVDIVILDVDESQKPDIVANIFDTPDIGKFDAIVASHVLEHVPYRLVPKILEWFKNSLVEGGSLYVFVPSLEWAAREILSENPSPALFGHLYAGQVNEWDVHLSGFTMRLLRKQMEMSGFSVIFAQTQKYSLVAFNGKQYDAHEHYVIGVSGAPPLSKE